MKLLWNEGWRFAKLPSGSTFGQLQEAETAPVMLPHDMLIGNEEDLYESADGWYLHNLEADRAMCGKCVLLCFDGVYMDADVLLDGRPVFTHRYGYTAFQVDLTPFLTPGSHQIAVHIRHRSPNSRWYSGAGIFRDVYLHILPPFHMVPGGVRVKTYHAEQIWHVLIRSEFVNEPAISAFEQSPVLSDPDHISVFVSLHDAHGGLLDRVPLQNSGQDQTGVFTFFADLSSPRIQPWSPEDPVLYTLRFELPDDAQLQTIGFRETAFTPDRGFFLNGVPLKLHGVCLHHDLGALGSAFHIDAARRQLLLMKQMGANAIRTSHNPPADAFLDLCDRMGFLVVDELYDMWEIPKTEYDHARFFTETWQEDVADWVRRDRCHPSVILWSIGNEIPDMHVSERGQLWTRRLMQEVHKHDDFHAPVTFGSNYMPWEGAQKCADIVKIPGYNYAEKYYEAHHKVHPDWILYGSETGSVVQSRGIYHFPFRQEILSEEDLQCSSLGNSRTSWGTRDPAAMLSRDLQTPYSLGQFLWSGIDYIGEPTPYHTRSSYFGQADTACFPKDAYYLCQAMWTDRPMVHIGVYWDWNEGQLIDVPVITNAPKVRLLLNGVSLGEKRVDRMDPENCLPVWQVPYRKGCLEALALDGDGNLLSRDVKYSFKDPVRLLLSLEEPAAQPAPGNIVFVTVTAADADGFAVENAVDRVHAGVCGPGILLGADNGDSTDPDGYQRSSRRLFSGKLLLMIGVLEGNGPICIDVTAKGLEGASLEIPVRAEGKALPEKRSFFPLCSDLVPEDEIYVRKISLEPLSGQALSPEKPSASFQVRLHPAAASDQQITFRVVNAAGIDMTGYEMQTDADIVTVTARTNGEVYLRASVRNGAGHPRILSCLEIVSSGFPQTARDPYHFIPGALYDQTIGEITPGNEHGAAFARDGFSAAGYTGLDFGREGSDELTAPVFALDGSFYEIGLWDGHPQEGGRLLSRLPYQKPSIWNTYQEETWKLPETLKGRHDLWFCMDRKIHLKGFSFRRLSAAFRYHDAAGADEIYGDSFRHEGDAVCGIGNNVTLVFQGMWFENEKNVSLILDGATGLETQAVTIRIRNEEGIEMINMCRFLRSPERGRQSFPVQVPAGMCAVSFVFLPGSSFDFYGFQFGFEQIPL